MLPAWFAPHKSLRVISHRLRGVNIGKNVEIGYFCILDNVHPNMITIEDDAVITAGVTILAHDNAMHYTWDEDVAIGPTRICKRAFIGVNSVIMPKVTIGEKAIIGANSVVTKDVPSGAVFAGSPAKLIRKKSS